MYYLSKALQGTKARYDVEKSVVALVVGSQELLPYF